MSSIINILHDIYRSVDGNIGIGTATPRQNLDVIGDIITSGNIGIGTIIPSGKLQIYKSNSTPWTELTRLQASDAETSDSFSYSVSISSDGNTVAIGARFDDNSGGTNAGSVYIFTRTAGGTWAEQTRLQASDATGGDEFGYSVSINSDGTTVVVGAYMDDNSGGTNAGSVYIFTRTAGGTWTEQTRLQASDATGGDDFGLSVSINSDGTTVAIGAFMDDNSGGDNAGSVYIFTRTAGGTWEQQTRLQASDVSESDRFGNAVSINSDGTTLAIGASYVDTFTGSVYVFTRTSGGNWEEQTKLRASDISSYDQYGQSVSLNSDGTTLAIGSPYHANSGGIYAGNVYIYTRTSGGTWAEQTRLQASDASNYDYFGRSVSINTDGTTMAIGAWYDNNSGGPGTGSVYIFTRTLGGSWTEQTKLIGSDSLTNDNFGWSVSINSDGTTLAISSPYHDNSGGTDAGSAYVFTRNIGSGKSILITTSDGNVGIGTTTPKQALDVTGDIITSGNVGIGTSLPRVDLDIIGDIITSGNVGIGTTTPRQNLDINGTGIISTSLGIGTTLPVSALHVEGIIQCASGDNTKIQFTEYTNGSKIEHLAGWGLGLYAGIDNADTGFISFNNATTAGFVERVRIDTNGNLGIGTTTPRKALDTIGDIIASGNVGIGTSTPQKALHVTGDINFTGDLYKNNSLYVSSQWITSGSNIYYNSGNIGIGTTSPKALFEVYNSFVTWSEQIRLQASDATANDKYSNAVSIDSNGTTLVVGTSYDDNSGGTDAGSVYIFTRTSGGSWTEQTRLQGSSSTLNAYFGASVSINTSGTLTVIGADGEDDGAGSVYIYTRTIGGSWTYQTRLQASNPHFGYRFGSSVSINNDDTTLAIGSKYVSDYGGLGAVFVFTRTAGGVWAEQTYIIPSNPIDYDFGYAVSINSDGTTLAISTPVRGQYTGSAYVFTRTSGGNWVEQIRIQPSDIGSNDAFGRSISINSDGTTLAIGSPYDTNSGGIYAGSVYIYTRTAGGTWERQIRLQASDASTDDAFGHAVSINSDGTTLAIGSAYDTNSGGSYAGSIYIFTRTAGGTWNEQTRLQASDASSDDYFGNAVSINSDGTVIAVGAWFNDNSGGINAGSAYVFTKSTINTLHVNDINGLTSLIIKYDGNVGIGTSTPQKALDVVGDIIASGNVGIGTSTPQKALDVVGDIIASGNVGIGTILPKASLEVHSKSVSTPWSEQVKLIASDASSDDYWYGNSVSINGDATTLAVGAVYNTNSGGVDAGSVYIYTRTAGGSWAEQTRLQASDAASASSFGYSVSMNYDGTTLAVGAKYDTNSGGFYAGSVYVFTRTSGGSWAEQTRLQASDAVTGNDAFGNSVSINNDGTTIAVGALYDDNSGGFNAGSVYVFTRTGGTWIEQTRLQASDATDDDIFGWSVAINSDGTILAIGSLYHDTSGGTNSGSVYIFTRTSGGAWSQQTRLQASDAAPSDRFGVSVSINSDGTTLAIGADIDNNSSGTAAGSVYIFTRTSGGSLAEQTRLQVSDTSPAGEFLGWSVSINSNGTTLVSGAIGHNTTGGTNAGSVYVFTRTGGTWAEQTRLQVSDTTQDDWFGYSVSMNADGTTFAGGAIQRFSTNIGKAYVFTRSISKPEILSLYDTDGTNSIIVHSDGNMGIGTTTPRQKLDVMGDIITSTNVGIGTTTPRKKLDVIGDIIGTTNIGIGTATPRKALDVIGDIITSANIGIGTTLPVAPLHVQGITYLSTNVGIGTTITRGIFEVNGSTISTSVGIGTTLIKAPLHVEGVTYLRTNVGIGTTITRSIFEVNGTILSTSVGIGTTLPRRNLDIHQDQNATTGLYIQNPNTSTAAISAVSLYNSANMMIVGMTGTGYTVATPYAQNAGIIETDTNMVGGLALSARSSTASIRFFTGGAIERMRVAIGGNIGINTTAPRKILDVVGDAIVSANIGIGTTLPRKVLDIIGDTIVSANIGIGTTLPRYKLDVTGLSYFSSNVGIGTATIRNTVDVIGSIIASTSIGIGIINPSYQLQLSTDSAAKPTTNTWTVSSDARIKEDIQNADLNRCYDVVKDLRLCRFKWNSNYIPNVSDEHMLGWIAQEVEPFIPNAISRTSNYGFYDLYGLDSDQIIKFMYGAIQKNIKTIEEQQLEINKLKQFIATKFNDYNL